MQNLMATWAALDGRRRALVAGATVAVFLAVLGLARIAGQPSMGLLYAGLDPAAAGEVLAALEARGVAYTVQGDSIRVEAGRRDELRLALAAEGLPATGAVGYELLDGLSGFGTTAQMFDAAYWRAKEGELARTVLSMPGVRAARVHIAQAPSQPFQRDRRATASVAVTTSGAGLTAAQARALRHLVAAAVAGMRPEDVQVIDSAQGLIGGTDEDPLPAQTDARAAELKAAVERLLAARMGPGRAVVEVSLDIVTERESLTERRFDPAGRVAISTETEERAASGTEPGGEVTVASNLPEGDAAPGAPGRSQSTETRERTNWEVSETSRELLRLPGSVRRMTVAVMVDGTTAAGPDGAPVFTPLPESEIEALRELVAAAVGLDTARGDVLTLRSMPFETVAPQGTEAEAPGFFAPLPPLDPMTVIQAGVLAFVLLVLAVFVVRPLLAARPPAPALPAPGTAPGSAQGSVLALADDAGQAGGAGLRVLNGEIDDGTLPPLSRYAGDEPPEDPVQRLRRLIEERRDESAEILRGWMEAEAERR